MNLCPSLRGGSESCSALSVKAGAADLSSINLGRLARLAEAPSALPIRVHLLDPGVTFESSIGAKAGQEVVLKSCSEYFHIPCTLGDDDKSLAQGITLFPVKSPLEDQTFYSTNGLIEVYVGARQAELEIAKTIVHELTHADFYRKTGAVDLSGHVGRAAKEVNHACLSAENEAAIYWGR